MIQIPTGSKMIVVNGGPGSGVRGHVTPKKHHVYIHKVYFPPEIQPKEIGKEDFEQWVVPAISRQEAAKKVWATHGNRLLGLMGPKKTKLPRKVSLFVSAPEAGVGGKAGRLSPIIVYEGE
jgi:hypothetical protein